MKKFQKKRIRYLDYMRRGIIFVWCLDLFVRHSVQKHFKKLTGKVNYYTVTTPPEGQCHFEGQVNRKIQMFCSVCTCHGRRNWGGQGGGGLAPPLFRDVEKNFNGENAHEWCKCGVKFEFFWKFFRLASLAFLIIEQQFKINII